MSVSPGSVVRKARTKKAGLRSWMQRVLKESDRAKVNLAPDPVHDLRVSLRRCRSIADGFISLDPDPTWKEMKKAGRCLFSQLGELRDVHVMQAWVARLATPLDPAGTALREFLSARQNELKQEAVLAISEFDRKQWRRWSTILPRRTRKLRSGGAIFKHVALERWVYAYDLHRRALRSRSQIAFHNLRIGIKRFRYIVENFLPQQHSSWSSDLKHLQDLLGEVHDLDVLWATAVQIHAFPDQQSQIRWQEKIAEERRRRIQEYREKMLGKSSLWRVWRSELPHGRRVEAIALARLRLWGALLDPDFKHSLHVTRLALQLYDGLTGGKNNVREERLILEVAALLHDIGRSQHERGHHKTSSRLIRRLSPPLGWSGENLRLAALVARYHRGALPGRQIRLRSLDPENRRLVLRLAGILRLANAFDADRQGRVPRLAISQTNGFINISAQNYSSQSGLAEAVAAARHLLEVVYRRPVLVKPMRIRKAA